MGLIRLAIARPVAVMSAVFLVTLMGWVALYTIPIQLTPDIRRPVISVGTQWTGAAPAEVEREVLDRQEKALKGLEGLERIEGRARRNAASVTLEFGAEQNLDRLMLLVNNRLSNLSGLPEDARQGRLQSRSSDDAPIASFVIRTRPGNARHVDTYLDYVEDVIQERMERVKGVALVEVSGGRTYDLRVIVEPQRMARYGLTIANVVDALRGTNVNISAGDISEGKRQYVVRTESELSTLERVRQVPLRSDVDAATGRVSRVTVGDIAHVEFGLIKRLAQIRYQGGPAIVVNVIREAGTNVIAVMDALRAEVADLNGSQLVGEGLSIEQVYDETEYINAAVDLVTGNIWEGGALAVLVLLLFLRCIRSTLVVALCIPVSVIGSFVAMAALGRSLNVISLAGIAFAVGLVVDAAIVVLENIFRLRQRGLSRTEAALQGTSQVWGPILASAATTVVVFAPILMMNLAVGQLFRDIAVAITVSVLLSLVVSITVIPALASRILRDQDMGGRYFRLPGVDPFADAFVRWTVRGAAVLVSHRAVGIGVVLLIIGGTALGTWLYLPKLEYLPEGNRNLVVANVQQPPGYNLETTLRIAETAEDRLRPLWATETGPQAAPDEPPKIDRFWFVARPTSNTISASAVDPKRAAELIPLLREAAFTEPGTFGFVNQTSILGRSIGGGRVVDLNISGPDLEALLDVARDGVRLANQAFPRGTQVRPQPGLELGAPEVRVTPDLTRLADIGLTARELGQAVDVFNDGLKVSEVTIDGRRMDLTLMGPEDRIERTQGIGDLPVVTRKGSILPVNQLAAIEVTEGPTEIYHLDRQRTVQVQVRPSTDIALESAIDTMRQGVMGPLIAQGLPAGVSLRVSRTADALSRAWQAMQLNLLVAVIVVYLVMAILLESFIYPLVIMLSVPLATAGGVVGLALLNIYVYQPLDMLTLLGFVILIGTVANNAILLVYQTLHHTRHEGMAVTPAILEATRNRIRPIFMSTMSNICGMLPLVLMPGAGSELYRGLGAVVIGGLALSTVLTLLIIPPLLRLIGGVMERETARAVASPAATGQAAE